MPQNALPFAAIISPQGSRLASLTQVGVTWFVNPSIGSDSQYGGVSRATPFATFAAAQAASLAGPRGGYGDAFLLAPGSYDETITIVRPSIGSLGWSIVGMGNRGSVGIAPSASNANALVNDADDVSLINIGLAAVGTGSALINTGARLRASQCKLENDDGTGFCAQMTLQTVAQRAAHTKGNGADCLFDACEFAWAANGVKILGTDQGAVTELRIQGSRFHDLATAHILEGVGSGGSAGVTFASLELIENTFGPDEAGAIPTHFVLLNADNANSGIASGNRFPVANNSGKNLVSTKLFWASNFMTDGVSAAQPS